LNSSVLDRIEAGSELRQWVDAALQRRGQAVQERMAQHYNKRHAVHISAVGDMVGIGTVFQERAELKLISSVYMQKLLQNNSRSAPNY